MRSCHLVCSQQPSCGAELAPCRARCLRVMTGRASPLSGSRESFNLYPGERNFMRFPMWLVRGSFSRMHCSAPRPNSPAWRARLAGQKLVGDKAAAPAIRAADACAGVGLVLRKPVRRCAVLLHDPPAIPRASVDTMLASLRPQVLRARGIHAGDAACSHCAHVGRTSWRPREGWYCRCDAAHERLLPHAVRFLEHARAMYATHPSFAPRHGSDDWEALLDMTKIKARCLASHRCDRIRKLTWRALASHVGGRRTTIAA